MGRKKSMINAELVASAEQALAEIKDGYVAISTLLIRSGEVVKWRGGEVVFAISPFAFSSRK